MAISVSDFIRGLKSDQKVYADERVQISLLSALDAAALVKRRVINERLDESGGYFGTYSKRYQQQRIENNLEGDKVNFSFTNDMWKSTTARVVSVTDTEVVVFITPSAKEIYKLIELSKRFGTILEMNATEKAMHASIYDKRFKEL